MYDEWGCALRERIEGAIDALTEDERRSPRRVLRALVAAVGGHVVERAATCRVLMEGHTLAAYVPAIAEVVAANDVQSRQQLERLVREGMTAGEWPSDTDPALEARLIAATLHGLMASWHLAPGSFDWDDVATSVSGPVTR